jgi:hypothetical protein
VRDIDRLLVVTIRALYGHPCSGERTFGTLSSSSQFCSAFITDDLRFNIRPIARASNVAMTAERPNVGPSPRLFNHLDRMDDSVFNDRSVWVAGALSACSNFLGPDKRVINHRNNTAAFMAWSPARFIYVPLRRQKSFSFANVDLAVLRRLA